MEELDYTELAKSRMTDQHRNDPAFVALVSTITEFKNRRRQQYLDIVNDFLDIDKSEGKALDVIGGIIGQPRALANFITEPYFGFKGARNALGFDVGYWYSRNNAKLGTMKIVNDEQYRRLIKARIKNNKSRCTRDELLEILNLLTNNKLSEIQDVRHGVFNVNIASDADGLASYFLSKYRDKDSIFSIPLGYRMKIEYLETIPEPPLEITCVGATNLAVFNSGVSNSSWNSVTSVYVNDIAYTKPTSLIQYGVFIPETPIDGYQVYIKSDGASLSVRNVGSTIDVKVKLMYDKSTTGNIFDTGISVSNLNPTVGYFTESGSDFAGLCLSAADADIDLYENLLMSMSPKAYYKMSDTNTGTVVSDSSGSGYHAELQYSESSTLGFAPIRRFSKGSIGFNTQSSGFSQCYVSNQVGGEFFQKLAGAGKSCTIALWITPTNIRQYGYLFTYILDSTQGTCNYRAISYSGNPFQIQSPHNRNDASTYMSQIEMVNQKVFIVWRKDAVASKYSVTTNGVNGELTGNSSPETLGEGFFFPMSQNQQSFGFIGSMSDMSVFDRALSDDEISALYKLGKPV